jgi:flagellar hook-basal body complex protein FliE
MSTVPGSPLAAFFTPTTATQSGTAPTMPTSVGGDAGESSFESVLKTAVAGVEQMHTSAQEQVTQLAMGDRQDIHNVMIAVEKADVAFQLMMQVRNKIVNAYQEVTKMQF